MLELEAELSKYLPGQPDLLSRVAKSIRRELCLCQNFSRPLGRFILRTPDIDFALKLAVGLATSLFDDRLAVLHLAMENYGEKHQISSLIGHAGGFLWDGYLEGELTEPLRRRPQTVVVLSEIERMHLDASRILLPIFSGEPIFDGLGRIVDFQNSIFIMTTALESRAAIAANIMTEYLQGTLILTVQRS
jgi:ATP-dependent Clp protease ATP-binding subunit ClpA